MKKVLNNETLKSYFAYQIPSFLEKLPYKANQVKLNKW